MTHYTVDALLENLLRTAFRGIGNDFPEEITVEGNVSKVKDYDGYSYFTLKGTGRNISVRCPTKLAPNEGKDIVFKGTISCKTDKFSSGISVFITGRPEGSYTPVFEKRVLSYSDYGKKDHTSLSELVSRLKDQAIVIIGTDLAHKDIIKTVPKDAFFKIDYEIVTVSSKSKVKKFLTELKADNTYKAMVFTRGGNESTMGEVWNDPLIVRTLLDFQMPYYTALGHADSVTLSDKFASEMFITPTDFGHALSKSIDNYNDAKNILSISSNRAKTILEKDESLVLLESKLKVLQRNSETEAVKHSQESNALDTLISQKNTSYYKMLTGSFIFIILLLSIISLVVFYLYKNSMLIESFEALKIWISDYFE